MSSPCFNPIRVLGICPKPRGFGFAILEGPATLVDWSVRSARKDKRKTTLARVAELVRQYRPQVIVLEDGTAPGSRRCRRIRSLINGIRRQAMLAGLKSRVFSRSQVRKVFSVYGATTKYEIGRTIANLFPELASHMPRRRKPWMSEDHRMAFFEAVALALTYFHTRPRFVTRPAPYSLQNHSDVYAEPRAHFSH